MKKSNYFKAVLIALILVSPLFTTCQSLQGVIQEPVVTLHSVELAKLSFTGVEILCKLNVENRSPVTIPFPNINWELFINEYSFLKGNIISSGNTLRARETSIVDVPVSLTFVEFFNVFQSLRGSNNTDYRVAVGASFNIPVIGELAFNFEHSGNFPVLQIPKFSAPSFKIDGIDFTKVQVSFSINVENENEFDLPAPQVISDLLINRNPYLQGISVSAVPLAAAAVTPLVIGLTVEYEDLFRVFANLLNSREVPSVLNLNGDFGIPAFAGEVISQQISGTLPILRAPSVSFRGISLKNLSLTNIDFELSWEIENNNSFAVSLKDLSYNFSVNNVQWSSGRAPVSQVNANSRTVIPVQFSINSLSMVREITEIVTRGTSINYVCTGNMNLGGAFPGLSDLQKPFNFSGATRLSR